MNGEMDNISYHLELKSIQEGKNLFIEGYASVFGVLDSYQDIIEAGSFSKTISGKNGKRVKFCYQHEFSDVIGKIVELREDERGLWFKAKISNTTLGRDVVELIQDGALDEISIGFRTIISEWDSKNEIRTIKEVELYEISIVSRAANEGAVILGTEVKSEKIAELTDEQLISRLNELKQEYNKRILIKI